MGLDAVVYRNREHLEMGSDNARANMAQQTGEVYFEDNQLSRKYQYKVEAVAHRLGNVAAHRGDPLLQDRAFVDPPALGGVAEDQLGKRRAGPKGPSRPKGPV